MLDSSVSILDSNVSLLDSNVSKLKSSVSKLDSSVSKPYSSVSILDSILDPRSSKTSRIEARIDKFLVVGRCSRSSLIGASSLTLLTDAIAFSALSARYNISRALHR